MIQLALFILATYVVIALGVPLALAVGYGLFGNGRWKWTVGVPALVLALWYVHDVQASQQAMAAYQAAPTTYYEPYNQ